MNSFPWLFVIDLLHNRKTNIFFRHTTTQPLTHTHTNKPTPPYAYPHYNTSAHMIKHTCFRAMSQRWEMSSMRMSTTTDWPRPNVDRPHTRCRRCCCSHPDPSTWWWVCDSSSTARSCGADAAGVAAAACILGIPFRKNTPHECTFLANENKGKRVCAWVGSHNSGCTRQVLPLTPPRKRLINTSH